jgi:peptidoglycan hydrolase-like protein with peptidoglycan-binding domain
LAKHITPAVIETITSQKQLTRPVDQAGNLGHTVASYQTETRHVILNNRYERWFESICSDLMDTPLVTALQRALQDHDLYQGKIDGLMGPATKAAVHHFQRQNGLDSDTLSRRSAVLLELIED